MDEKQRKNRVKQYWKKICFLLPALCLFYFGMKDYAGMTETDTAAIELYGTFPTVSQAEKIWQSCQESEDRTDVCFLENGGVQIAENPEYSRQVKIQFTGITGLATLYDRACAALEEKDAKGCVIDRDTAAELFGSGNCVGSKLTVGDCTYTVRAVASFCQHMILVRASGKDTFCTQALVRRKKGQNLESAASGFLMSNGLTGTLADDSWLDVLVPWFPILFLALFSLAVEKNIVKVCGQKWSVRILVWGCCLFFILRWIHLPYDWLPDKWSDFSFWPAKIRKTMEAFRWYIMFPKTMGQTERLIHGISCMIKCGAAALLMGAV